MQSRLTPSTWFTGFLFVFLAVGAVAPQYIFAQSVNDDRRAQLQAQLNALEKEIADNQSTVDSLAKQGKSLSNEVLSLNAKIKKAQLQVQATQVAISGLDSSINLHEKAITRLRTKIDSERDSLAQILRRTNEIDNYSIVEVAFSQQDLSKVLGDLDSYTFLKESLGISYTQLSQTKSQSETERNALQDKREQQRKIAQVQLQAKQQVLTQQQQKQQLLATTKGQESAYQKLVVSKQKTAAQIRVELFGLAGGGGAIPFGVAAQNAKLASSITGVRPALILAILSQESDLGRNTGQCLVTDLTTGDGKGKNTGTLFPGTMKAPRDTVPFEALMSALGRNWQTTTVSCPQAGGYGGAMGPTQFIPSTWKTYDPRVKKALSVSASDPWNALHAIVATGLYLADVGASSGSSSAEHTAAAKYYAGSGWASAGQQYADSVMSKATKFQADIDTLNGN